MGIGIDMIEVNRVREKIEKNEGFKELVFSANEIVYCEKNAHPFEHYAARFAAKEAFLKAIGAGLTSGIALHAIEILNDLNGKPQLNVTVNTNIQYSKIFVSISHLQSIASAVVIIEI
jgi:holo-[acyl-carrier protein] synthase